MTEALVSYLRNLRLLHRLIATGNGDSPRADVVREQMDTPWQEMTVDERAWARAVSVRLGVNK